MEEWRGVQSEGFHNLYISYNFIMVIKSQKITQACSMNEKQKNVYNFGQETLKEL
jgi:hypothetical protein